MKNIIITVSRSMNSEYINTPEQFVYLLSPVFTKLGNDILIDVYIDIVTNRSKGYSFELTVKRLDEL